MLFFVFLALQPIVVVFFTARWRALASSCSRFLDHKQWHATLGRTSLDVWSIRRRDLYLTTHNTHNRQTSMRLVGFEPTISAGERPKTYALDRAVTGTIWWNSDRYKGPLSCQLIKLSGWSGARYHSIYCPTFTVLHSRPLLSFIFHCPYLDSVTLVVAFSPVVTCLNWVLVFCSGLCFSRTGTGQHPCLKLWGKSTELLF